MNTYEQRKQAKIDRLHSRATKKRAFADKNDLSLYGEAKSGIPMGQPILVGHHSERRHRKHLERIENKVRKGYEAAKEADRIEERIESIENRRAIDSDNPDAVELLKAKIQKLEADRDRSKKINQLIKKAIQLPNAVQELAEMLKEVHPNDDESKRLMMAGKLLEKDFCGRIGIPSWYFTNRSAEIRRLKKRLDDLSKIESGWPEIDFDGGKAVQADGRVLIYFDSIPSKDFRDKLKRSPFVFKWSPTAQAWSRKHTPTTQSDYFRKQLTELLKG